MATQITLLPLKVYQPNTYSFGPTSVPLGTVGAEIQLDLSHLTDLTLDLDAAFELSQDGVTWLPWGGLGCHIAECNPPCTLANGKVKDPKGVLLTFSGLKIDLPLPDNNQRQIRGTVTFNEPFNTQATLILT